jgi:hypothetical protein
MKEVKVFAVTEERRFFNQVQLSESEMHVKVGSSNILHALSQADHLNLTC